MSIPILSNFPIAMSKGLKKNPIFNTVVQRPVAGKGVAAASLQAYPTWTFEFDADRITGNEATVSSTIATFMGLHMASNGRTFPFLFLDPQDSTVTQSTSAMLNVTAGAAAPMGLEGDGVSTQFQLARVIGGTGYDIIQNVVGTPVVYVNGSATVAFSISSTGVITFTVAPASSAVLTWTGSFYFYVRFDEDELDCVRVYTQNSGTDIWDVNAIKFTSEFIQ
jgi:uncharacterized protein (TIGR02217 family)